MKESTHFGAVSRLEKFPDGPMMLPRPGPTLERQVATPVMAVTGSRPRRTSATAPVPSVRKKSMKKAMIESMTSSETACP